MEIKITRAMAIVYAKRLKEFCRDTDCIDCPFYDNARDFCALEGCYPCDDWNLPAIPEELKAKIVPL